MHSNDQHENEQHDEQRGDADGADLQQSAAAADAQEASKQDDAPVESASARIAREHDARQAAAADIPVPDASELLQGFEELVAEGWKKLTGHASNFDADHFEQYAALARQQLLTIFARDNVEDFMRSRLVQKAWEAVHEGHSTTQRNRAAIV